MQELQAFLAIEADRPKGPMLRLMALGVCVGLLELACMALVIPAIALISNSAALSDMPLPGWARQMAVGVTWRQSLLIIIGLLFAGYMVKAAVQIFYYYCQTALVARWQRDLAVKLLRGQLDAPFDDFLQGHSATVIRNITVLVHETYGRFLNSLFSLIADCSSAIALVGLSLIAAPLPALAGGLLMVSIYTVQHMVFQRIHTLLGQQSVELLEDEQLALQQSLGAFREVRVAGRAEHFLSQFRALQDAFRKTTFQFEFTRRLPPVLGELTIVLCVTVAVLVMMSAVAKPGQVTVALGLLAAVAFRLSPLANRVVGATGTIQNARAGLALLAGEVGAQRCTAAATRNSERRPLSLADKLELKGVGYTYPGRDRPALQGIDLTIRRGEVIGIVGASGAGKTTLIDIILGLLVPGEGSVLVDGAPISADSHLNAGYVPQEIFLFDDTLRANVAFGAPREEVGDDEIRRVLGLVRLDGLLQGLPAGLDSKLGERGRLLSGGQRQRVRHRARALPWPGAARARRGDLGHGRAHRGAHHRRHRRLARLHHHHRHRASLEHGAQLRLDSAPGRGPHRR